MQQKFFQSDLVYIYLQGHLEDQMVQKYQMNYMYMQWNVTW